MLLHFLTSLTQLALTQVFGIEHACQEAGLLIAVFDKVKMHSERQEEAEWTRRVVMFINTALATLIICLGCFCCNLTML